MLGSALLFGAAGRCLFSAVHCRDCRLCYRCLLRLRAQSPQASVAQAALASGQVLRAQEEAQHWSTRSRCARWRQVLDEIHVRQRRSHTAGRAGVASPGTLFSPNAWRKRGPSYRGLSSATPWRSSGLTTPFLWKGLPGHGQAGQGLAKGRSSLQRASSRRITNVLECPGGPRCSGEAGAPVRGAAIDAPPNGRCHGRSISPRSGYRWDR